MHNSAAFLLAHVMEEKNMGSGLKKCLCVCVLSAFSMWCKRKTHMNGLKKCLFVRINFHVVEPRTPLMLWKS